MDSCSISMAPMLLHRALKICGLLMIVVRFSSKYVGFDNRFVIGIYILIYKFICLCDVACLGGRLVSMCL